MKFHFEITADDQVVEIKVNDNLVLVIQVAHAFTSDLENELRKALGTVGKSTTRPLLDVLGR